MLAEHVLPFYTFILYRCIGLLMDCGSKNVDVFVKVTGYCVEYDLHPFCQETQNLCEAGDAIGL